MTVHRCVEHGVGADDAAGPVDFTTHAMALIKGVGQWPTIQRFKPDAHKVAFFVGIVPVLVSQPRVKYDVIVQKLHVAAPEPHVEALLAR